MSQHIAHPARIPSHKEDGELRYLRIARGLFFKLMEGMKPEDMSKRGYQTVVDSIHRNLAKAKKELKALDPDMSLKEIEKVLSDALEKDRQNPNLSPSLAASTEDFISQDFAGRFLDEYTMTNTPGMKR
jgi:hypothetical protein